MMREVTWEEFFARIGPLDVHPRPLKDVTEWEMQDGSRKLVGRSYPGYMCDGPKKWFLA